MAVPRIYQYPCALHSHCALLPAISMGTFEQRKTPNGSRQGHPRYAKWIGLISFTRILFRALPGARLPRACRPSFPVDWTSPYSPIPSRCSPIHCREVVDKGSGSSMKLRMLGVMDVRCRSVLPGIPSVFRTPPTPPVQTELDTAPNASCPTTSGSSATTGRNEIPQSASGSDFLCR